MNELRKRSALVIWICQERCLGVALICMAAMSFVTMVSAQTAAPSQTADSIKYVNNSYVPGPVRKYLASFGNRLSKAGSERTVLTGTYSDDKGSGPATLIWQTPGLVRLERTQQPALIYSDNAASTQIAATDASVLESLLDDSFQSFALGFSGTGVYRYLGGRLRPANAPEGDYKGPWYDVYLRVAPVMAQPQAVSRAKLFYFDSVTGFPTSVQYTLPGKISVVTEYGRWISVNGQAFPGQIVRKENGKITFSFVVTQGQTSPAASDGAFTSR